MDPAPELHPMIRSNRREGQRASLAFILLGESGTILVCGVEVGGGLTGRATQLPGFVCLYRVAWALLLLVGVCEAHSEKRMRRQRVWQTEGAWIGRT